MKVATVNSQLSISGQLAEKHVHQLAEAGVAIFICNRPDNEETGQPSFSSLRAAAEASGAQMLHLPFKTGAIEPAHIESMRKLLKTGKRLHAFCRTGNRSFCLYAAAYAQSGGARAEILDHAQRIGIDIKKVIQPYYGEVAKTMTDQENNSDSHSPAQETYDVVVVGAGSGGIAVASSLLKRNPGFNIALIDPAEEHFYQPGWTMVGGGIFDVKTTRRTMKELIPAGVSWIRQAVTKFHPAANAVELDDARHVNYQQLVVSPGLKLDWAAIEGLEETLGKHGVTSNYDYKLAPYTWELVRGLKSGKALFTQPPMPIKCAGAPQKAIYLSCDQWRRAGLLDNIDVEFHNAGGVLFGVADYVPALQSYIDRYGVNVAYNSQLYKVDGEAGKAYFRIVSGEREGEEVEKSFDMIHVCPPQRAPDFVAESELAGAGGWLEVDQFSLRHKRFENVWGLGDVMDTPNAKTMAAVRKQVPVVAQNICDVLSGKGARSGYDGYGSCPLTVERGKIVLAEFGYGGKIIPTFPTWMFEGKKPTRAAWMLKKDILPGVYWNAMLKGKEWLAEPQDLEQVRT